MKPHPPPAVPAASTPRVLTLGINATFHDSAAALMRDGEVIAAVEEERFTRIKHGKRPLPFTAWELPWHAIDDCLKQAGVTLGDVTDVAYSFDPQRFIGDRAPEGRFTLPLRPSDAAAGNASKHASDHAWENPWDPLFAAYVLSAPRLLTDGVPHHLRRRFAGVRHADAPYRWHFVPHHLCHQASAFLAAPFSRCAVMTLDGRGERATTAYGRYRDCRYESLGEVQVPHSLGLMYERVTTYLGFLHSSDEYKVMAMAAMGQPRHIDVLRQHLVVGADGQYRNLPLDLAARFGPARVPGSTMDQRYLDLAASVQLVLEETVLRLATWLRERTGEDQLAMAGGVALNCVMNGRLRDAGIFDEVWVQPAAGDAGTALGAALWTDAVQRGGGSTLAPRRWQMRHAYWGPHYDDDTIEQHLRWAKLPYRRSDDLSADVAQLLAANRIVGWFQGRMEFGPRALGARSILASPIEASMQTKLNALKDREDFRPVAPAVPQEDLGRWFAPPDANGGQSPFMLFVYDVLPVQRERIPAACHIDRTARVQTVEHDSNPRFHSLLREFGRRTGVPVLVNTSFNVRGAPIVCSPRDAIEAFYGTPLDALAIGSFILEKRT
jgi:carbamoyltransferase